MKVFVAGATGAIGRSLVPALLARAHAVVGLSRSEENDRLLRAWGAGARRADITDAHALADAIAGCDVVVRIATHIPKGEWSAEEVAQNDRIRVEGTRALLDAARRAGAGFFVQESVAWSNDADPTTRTAVVAERMAAADGLSSATLRLGWLYGAASAHTRHFADLLRAARFTIPSAAQAEKSFLHLDDAADAFVRAIETRPVGTFDVADLRPASVGEFFDAFADALKAPRPRRDPSEPGFFGLENRVDPAPFRAATRWTPRFPTIADGLRQVAASLPTA